RSSDLFEAGGKSEAGELIYTMMPFVNLHELIKYGKYASNTAMDGFSASNAAVMAVHSADDDVVPIEYGYDLYYEKYKDDPRFTFVRFEDKGHNSILNDKNNTYNDEINAQLKEYLGTLGYDYNAEQNRERFRADKAEFIRNNLDRQKWSHRLDLNLFSQFLKFYDEHLS
ncbi:MAG: alpha/beta hydrolase, partial [Ruminiclostridium sp.]|nr:alpha/beta hydrolase [Ruminiclostridium sp.]